MPERREGVLFPRPYTGMPTQKDWKDIEKYAEKIKIKLKKSVR